MPSHATESGLTSVDMPWDAHPAYADPGTISSCSTLPKQQAL